MDQLRQSFAASGFNIQQLLVDISTVASLRDSDVAAAKKSQSLVTSAATN
jgi:hypothetical protein